MVLFVTGLCDSSCYYCPLSREKAGLDVVFADEMPVAKDEDVLAESEAIGAEGAGISGGDPLVVLDRTLHYIRLLKSRFGRMFHIHLYTSRADIDEQALLRLQHAGLDEIRFHPQCDDWSGIEYALTTGMSVGIEVPAIPSSEDELKSIAKRAESMGIDFLNINELEASETNFRALLAHGLRLADLSGSSILGSADTARSVIRWGSETLEHLTIHYCSSRFKDVIQMRNRLERRLRNTIRPFEEHDTDDPLLIVGVIRGRWGTKLNDDELSAIHIVLENAFGVDSRLLNIDTVRHRVEIAPWIMEDIASQLREILPSSNDLEIGIAYEYPSWDRLQVLFEPL